MTTQEILTKYLEFYKKRGHKQVPNVSLVPEGDSTLLFVNSGMFPLVPYLSGESHPLGKRLVNVQRAGRFATDLDEVGDRTHTVAFHMIGNWSLGDYFKDEQLPWAYEFLIEEIKLDPNRLIATVFEGDESAPKDDESIKIIQEIFKKYGIDAKEGVRIFPRPKEDNWWQRGEAVGELGGPDSEVHYFLGEGSPEGKDPIENESEFIEIGNSVFMQYRKTETGWEELPQKNVDFGGGLERLAMVVQGKNDIFETDSFWPIIEKAQEITGKRYGESEEVTIAMRILADHMRACVLLAMDGVRPSNKDQGYMLRRLIRRMVRAARKLGFEKDLSTRLVGVVTETLSWLYPDLPGMESEIKTVFENEEVKFLKTLEKGTKEVDKSLKKLTGNNLDDLVNIAFDLYQSLGYPAEIFIEDVKDKGISVNQNDFTKAFDEKFEQHQAQSRAGSEQKFKGGLADHSDTVVKYHTTTHLLQRALKNILGDHVRQIGSNITSERLRFDFVHDKKLTDEEITRVEKFIAESVEQKYPVNFVMLPREGAMQSGALYLAGETYPEEVKVYYIGESLERALSKEFCGGPHVSNTSELSEVEIYKQETLGDGKQRVYVRFIN
ncbi:alanine--tRNA ligase [candidate division WWE3 bacterium]|jgi:alanyl-tRNA synthetase|uniref:alanine--tRNA ligase n=1 Tax=candidate division WWE3 bacterium TaxID=2053526 RepID=A0A3A4ZCF6_UNCKA|nr:MAG: alanine--tRNA ligase [candidate division WWE3 bacterium]